MMSLAVAWKVVPNAPRS